MWRFCFARIRLNPLSGKILYHDSVPVIVSGFTSLIEDFVISAVIKSPNFSARGRASPVRLLQGALSCWFSSIRRHFGLMGSDFQYCASRDFVATFVGCFWIWFLRTVCGCWQFLFPPDFFWTLPTTQEDLPTGRPNSSCHPSFYFCFGLRDRTSFLEPLRHFALILNLKMNLQQVAPVPWVLVLPLFSTSPVIEMLKTHCFQNWRITLERQEVRSYPSCRW